MIRRPSGDRDKREESELPKGYLEDWHRRNGWHKCPQCGRMSLTKAPEVDACGECDYAVVYW